MGDGPPEDGRRTRFNQFYLTGTATYLLRQNSWHRRRLCLGNKVTEIRGAQAAQHAL